MHLTLETLADLLTLDADDIIDVRAPAEFDEDHVPGAISLPVLDDAERATVGTLYTQVDRFQARKTGAALVARNAAGHLEQALADKPGGWQPLVYCWRGGQRSGSFASILSQIGWRVRVLEGGYRSYRRLVVRAVHEEPIAHRIVLLDGNTGTAKTEILNQLQERGVQVLDLEGMARHRGSVFGHLGVQPSQKAFEGRIAMALARHSVARPVLVEAESSKIGGIQIPTSLWTAMRMAPRIRVEAPLAARARYLVTAYGDIIADADRLNGVLAALLPMHGREVIAQWQAMAVEERYAELAEALMRDHYDPRYAKSAGRKTAAPVEVVQAGALDPAGLDGCVDQVAGILDAMQAQISP